MADIEAAIGYVMAHGDQVDRARLSWLRSAQAPAPDVLAKAEMGQAPDGGWPAFWAGDVASIDATCFRLAELDDLGALHRAPARRALAWLTARQQPDGGWEEDESLADSAPPWARPGDPEARLYLTANAGFWLAVAGPPPASADPDVVPEPAPADPESAPAGTDPVAAPASAGSSPAAPADEAPARPAKHRQPDPPAPSSSLLAPVSPAAAATAHAEAVARATQAFRAAMRDDGSWPSFLITGWLGGALLYHAGWFYEAAQTQVLLAERVPDLTPADTAWLAAAFRRVGMPADDKLIVAARKRLAETQRSDGGWPNDDGDAFDVHTTLAAIRALG
jgi:hypothetical protein